MVCRFAGLSRFRSYQMAVWGGGEKVLPSVEQNMIALHQPIRTLRELGVSLLLLLFDVQPDALPPPLFFFCG